MNVKKYLLFAVLDKTEIIIYESNIFFPFFCSSQNFQKFYGKYFSGKATSLMFMYLIGVLFLVGYPQWQIVSMYGRL